jgi:prepilin-type N-terminal cleavage/methylation domain-containing protein/prepilin-type processing-associated H-X9-DG protein
MHMTASHLAHTWGRRSAFTLAELLVVLGIISLLLAISVPPLQIAQRQAKTTKCAAQLQQIGLALEQVRTEYDYYPIWDDGGSPTRYTWVDILVESGHVTNVDLAYCPEDPRPSPINAARARAYNVIYPGETNQPGIDYSYGIGVPLSAGGWNWSAAYAPAFDSRPRRFEGHDRNESQRVLAADSHWSAVYNLSGDALQTNDWSWPSQFDNTVAYRHRYDSANFVYQDGHVSRLHYKPAAGQPINTALTFLWYPGEPVNVAHDYSYRGNFYPDSPPIGLSNANQSLIPRELVPQYYTQNLLWTRIRHK